MEYEVDVKKLEDLANELFPGLTMFVRDVNLPQNAFEKYEIDAVIREKAFVDASARVMGMITTHRYAILSNHMIDISAMEHGTNWGLCVANRDSRFKVLDIYEYEGKTQILLLHLPEDYRWKYFENTKFSIEDDLIRDSRERFKNKCLTEPVPELATQEWLDRCSFPIGMDEEGNFFDTTIDLKEVSMDVDEASFRDFYNKVIFAKLPEPCIVSVKDGVGGDEKDDSALLIGYIDEECGVSFHVLCTGRIENNRIIVSERDWSTVNIVRYDSVEHQSFIPQKYLDIDIEPFEDYINKTIESYATNNEDKLKIRDMDFLDQFRSPGYPDDLQVGLFKEGNDPEGVWVRCSALGEKTMFGKLLNEPFADFGVHCGDTIEFVPYQNDKEELFLVALLEKDDGPIN